LVYTFEITNDEYEDEENEFIYTEEFSTLKKARAFAREKIEEDRQTFLRKFNEDKANGSIPPDADFDDESDEVDFWPRSYFITTPREDPDDPEAIEVHDIWAND